MKKVRYELKRYFQRLNQNLKNSKTKLWKVNFKLTIIVLLLSSIYNDIMP
jgi:hypothetical protein